MKYLKSKIHYSGNQISPIHIKSMFYRIPYELSLRDFLYHILILRRNSSQSQQNQDLPAHDPLLL